MKHVFAIHGFSAHFARFSQELSFRRVVNQVHNKVFWSHSLPRKWHTRVGVGIRSNGRAVDNEFMVLYRLGA